MLSGSSCSSASSYSLSASLSAMFPESYLWGCVMSFVTEQECAVMCPLRLGGSVLWCALSSCAATSYGLALCGWAPQICWLVVVLCNALCQLQREVSLMKTENCDFSCECMVFLHVCVPQAWCFWRTGLKRWLWANIWGVGLEPGFSAKAARVINTSANSSP